MTQRLLKHFGIFLVTSTSFLLSSHSFAQVDCNISIDSEMPVCPGGSYTLSVNECENCTYEWKENAVTLPYTESSITVKVPDQTVFSVAVLDTITLEDCTGELLVTVLPDFEIDFIQRQLTCTNGDEPNGNNAKVEAIAKGDYDPDEYIYKWDVEPIQIAPGNPSLAIGLKAHLKYNITVTDKFECAKDSSFITDAYTNADIEIFADPDTAYIQSPHVTFAFLNHSADSIELSNFFWDFGDESETSDLFDPTHTYLDIGTYTTVLTAYNQQGCDSNYSFEVLVKPIKLFIPNVFTPDGQDNINQAFVITEATEDGDPVAKDTYPTLDTYYNRTELVIFNRWGRIVYKSDNYQNDWEGGKLPDGVYFYVLKCFGEISEDVYKGSVTIYGSGR